MTQIGRRWGPYGLLAPAIVLEAIFVAAPLAVGVYYSFHQVRYFKLGAFVGFDNYLDALTSADFLNSVAVTATFAFFSLFLTFGLGLALALYLERDSRLNVFIRASVLVPYMISMMVGSMLLKWMFSQDSGLLTILFNSVGIEGFNIIADPQGAFVALVANSMWRDSAFAMLLLLAGLKSIPTQLYQAAQVDGSTPLYSFWRISMPLLRIPILITIIRLLLHFVNILTYPLILTAGGPAGATETIVLRAYRIGFEDYALGRANAMAMLLLGFNLVAVALLVFIFKKKDTSI